MNSGIAKNELLLLRYLIDNPEYVSSIKQEYFSAHLAKDICKTIERLHKRKVNINKDTFLIVGNTINPELSEKNIETLFQTEYDKDAFNFYKEELKRNYYKSQLQNYVFKDVLIETTRKDKLSLTKIKEIKNKLDECISNIEDDNTKLYTINDIYDKQLDFLEKNRYGEKFYFTGCSELDKIMMTGFEPGYFYLLASHSGIGKSSFCTYLANKHITKQIPLLFIENEMNLLSTADRICAMRNNIPIEMMHPKGINNEIPQFVFDKIKKDKNYLENLNTFRYVDKPTLSIEDVRQIIIDTKKEIGVDRLTVFIDLLSKLKDFDGDNKASKSEDAVNKIDSLCKEENVAILGVLQLKRHSNKVTISKIEDIEKLRPHEEEIKNSGAFMERARLTITLFRQKYFAIKYLPEDPTTEIMEDIAEIDVLKQNMGQLGRIQYLFDGNICRFFPYEKEINNDETT